MQQKKQCQYKIIIGMSFFMTICFWNDVLAKKAYPNFHNEKRVTKFVYLYTLYLRPD